MSYRRKTFQLLVGSIFSVLASGGNAVTINVDSYGHIAVNAVTGGVTGQFTVTKKNTDGSTMTLAQLEKYLAQDHLNWFQFAVNQGTVTPTWPAKFIDPQSGGQGTLWADARPWYWDEVAPPSPLPSGRTSPPTYIPPAGQTELDVKGPSNGSTLAFADYPSGLDLDFSTFLISDYGNQTYKVLDGGFTWTARQGTPTAITGPTAGAVFAKEMQDKIQADFGWLRAAGPDLAESTVASPTWYLKEVAPQNYLIAVQPTAQGQRIFNTDGSLVQYARTVPQGKTSVTFAMPGMINGKEVSDATQRTLANNDPGTLQLAAFDANGSIFNSFSSWLAASGYNYPNMLDIPDFFPDAASGLTEIFYGVDAQTLLDFGESFINSYVFGEIFSVSQLMALLPGLIFSSTPLYYVPGGGWNGTPVDLDTMLVYVAYHQAWVPEPGVLILLSIGFLALLLIVRAGNRHTSSLWI